MNMCSTYKVPDAEQPFLQSKGMFQAICPLVLASASPRRQQFFRELGLDFVVAAAEIDERAHSGEAPTEYVVRLALEKAREVAIGYSDSTVVAADTIVVLDGRMLGKPATPAEAKEMLMHLSGRTHEVFTAFAISRSPDLVEVVQAVRSEVEFMEIPLAVCEAYVNTGESLDKAGAYGIQGAAGFLVRRVVGSYSNVVGLPLAEVVSELLRLGIIVPRAW